MTKRFILSVLVLCCLSAYYVFLFKKEITKPFNKTDIILIKEGSSIKQFISDLHTKNLIKNKFLTQIFIYFYLKTIPVGEFEIFPSDNIISLVNKINKNNFYYRSLTFLEGDTAYNYINQINNAFGLLGDITIPFKEGYLAPQTYKYKYGESKNSLIQRMINEQNKIIDEIWQQRSNDFPLETKDEMVILASIIEKEANVFEQKQIISGIYLNRLKIKMKLQADPTTIYQITNGQENFRRNVTFKDLETDGKYNTYKISGLPIGAISNPSKDTFKALINYKLSEDLFFIHTPDNQLLTSKKFKQHVKYADKFIRNNNKPSERKLKRS